MSKPVTPLKGLVEKVNRYLEEIDNILKDCTPLEKSFVLGIYIGKLISEAKKDG